MTSTRIVQLVLGLGVLALVACKPDKSGKSSRGKKPNIVVIHAHVGSQWNDVGYINPDVITPRMDELAGNGLKLDHVYMKGMSALSRANVLTGKLGTTLGMQTERLRPSKPLSVLPLSEKTLADRLRQEDYSTHCVGMWFSGYTSLQFTPTFRGFDTFYGTYNDIVDEIEHILPCPANTSDWGFDMWDNVGEDSINRVKPQHMVGTYNMQLFRNRVVQRIDRHDSKKPFFMYMPLSRPKGSSAYLDLYADKTHLSVNMRQRFAQATMIDDVVGDIVDALKYNGMWENTILVFLGDKPGPSAPYRNITHAMMTFFLTTPFFVNPNNYPETNIRGLSFIASPLLPNNRQGAHVSDMMHFTDMFPTLLSAAGIHGAENEQDVYGKNMWNVFMHGTPGSRTSLLVFMEHGSPTGGTPLYTDTFDTRIHAQFIEGGYTLWTGYFPTWSKTYFQYNLATDPGQLTDISDLPENTGIVRGMLDKMQAFNVAAAPTQYFLPLNGDDPASCPRHHGGYFAPWQ